jgi:hypothetical protein
MRHPTGYLKLSMIDERDGASNHQFHIIMGLLVECKHVYCRNANCSGYSRPSTMPSLFSRAVAKSRIAPFPQTVLAGMLVIFSSGALAEKIPVQAFFSNPVIERVELSPNGRFLSFEMTNKDKRMMLATMDIATRKLQPVANFSDVDVVKSTWVNDNRLLFRAWDKQNANGAYRFYVSSMVVVNRDGSDYRILGQGSADRLKGGLGSLEWGQFFSTSRLKNSEDIFVEFPEFTTTWEADRINLARLNTTNSTFRTYNRPGKSYVWVVDHHDVPRANVTIDQDREATYYKDDADGPWRLLTNTKLYSEQGITPVFFAPDGTLYVLARPDGDKAALYAYDIKNKRLSDEPILSLKGYDFNGQFIYNANKLLGIRYETDAEATLWFDDHMKQVQKDVDELLPDTLNQLTTSVRNETPYLIVKSWSDVTPAAHYLYNSQTRTLELLGKANPAIDPKAMSPMDLVEYKARDGLTIPAYLTLPKVKAKTGLPLSSLYMADPGYAADTGNGTPTCSFWLPVVTRLFNRSSGEALDSVTSISRPVGSSGDCQCRMTWPMQLSGRSAKALLIPNEYALPAPVTAVMPQ